MSLLIFLSQLLFAFAYSQLVAFLQFSCSFSSLTLLLFLILLMSFSYAFSLSFSCLSPFRLLLSSLLSAIVFSPLPSDLCNSACLISFCFLMTMSGLPHCRFYFTDRLLDRLFLFLSLLSMMPVHLHCLCTLVFSPFSPLSISSRY